MTLFEAANSGRRFKRPNQPDWLKLAMPDGAIVYSDHTTYSVSLKDLRATDWEVEPKICKECGQTIEVPITEVEDL